MITRRQLLQAGAFLPAAGRAAHRKTVAAVVTEYRHWSHADVIVGRLLGGYSANGVHTPPRTRVVSLYCDQFPSNDMSRDLAARHGFRIYPTIAQALTLDGSRLAVDAVVFVGEHGNYPTNELGQKLYPRYELFMQILDVFEQSGRAVPTFFDKHFSYSWEKAIGIYRRVRELKVPLMAGSSAPVTVRTPELEVPLETPIEKAVAVGHGDIDAYGFHLLECVQCMLERRAGGETGVRSVEFLEGDAVWKWRDSDTGSWSRPLLEAALRASPGREPAPPETGGRNAVLFLIRYRDGIEAAAFMLPRINSRTLALRIRDRAEPLSTMFGPRERTRPLPHFDGLVRCIEEMFITGKPLYPVERTLLTTGMLAFLFESKRARKPVETPALDVVYRAPRHVYFQRS
jgi:hypothetical protein